MNEMNGTNENGTTTKKQSSLTQQPRRPASPPTTKKKQSPHLHTLSRPSMFMSWVMWSEHRVPLDLPDSPRVSMVPGIFRAQSVL